jgi:putative sterol carrier protein
MMVTVQYRVVVAKKDERVDGPDDADLVVSIAAKDVGLDPTVAFMSGKLKAAGHTGVLLDVLRSGAAAAALARLAAS